jgi:prepilin-type N-terminal cleavage/methylation domain-containing protein
MNLAGTLTRTDGVTEMIKNRKGFTLIELMTVVVIISILVSIALPKFGDLKSKASLASIRSDIRNAEAAEETYFSDYAAYGTAANLQAAGFLSASTGNTLTVTVAPTGYTINGVNPAIMAGPTSCTVQVGAGAAPTVDGKITCP